MRTLFFLLLVSAVFLNVVAEESEEDSEEDSSEDAAQTLRSRGFHALEDVGVTFLDALIKKGQMEMAKGAFKTQMEVLRKVQPDQYKKYKKISIEQMAADAVFQQAEVAKLQPKTGNKLVDMLHENGIPIGSSLKGIEQAIKTQKDIEENDPTEQIAKAVFEKFQKQILPGLVANMIAGRNPFQLPQRQDLRKLTDEKNKERLFQVQHAEAMKALQEQQIAHIQKVQAKQYDLNPLVLKKNELRRKPKVEEKEAEEEDDEEEEVDDSEEEDEEPEEETGEENKNSVKLRRRRHAPIAEESPHNGRPLKELEEIAKETGEPQVDISLGSKAALVLGMTDYHKGPEDSDEDEDDDEEEQSAKRRAPIQLSKDLIYKLKNSPRLSALLHNDEIKYRANNPEELLEPKRPHKESGDAQPGYVIPRKVPARPRIMLPLTIGKPTDANALDTLFLPKKTTSNEDEEAQPLEPFRRRPISSNIAVGKSRVLENLRNNPALTAIFEDDELVSKLSKPSVLTSDQRGYDAMGGKGREMITYPRLHAAKLLKGGKINPMDAKVKQLVEERPIPPLFYVPTGRHTRLRWTGATEQDIPGLGGRFVLPSLDPTKPALNSVVSTQGKQRDEYDSTFKVPNYWQGGDIFGIKTHTKSEKLIGGNGMVDMPAMGENMQFGK